MLTSAKVAEFRLNKGFSDDRKRCQQQIPDWKPLWDMVECRFQRAPGENTIAIIGDSHAGHLYPGLITQTRADEGIAVFPAGCAVPLIGLQASSRSHPDWAFTGHLLEEGFRYILNHKNLTKVVLAHRPGCSWNDVADTQNPNNRDYNSIMHEGFSRTFDALSKAGKDIYVVLDNPVYKKDTFLECKTSVVRRPSSIPDFLSSKNLKSCSVKMLELEEKTERENWDKISHEIGSSYNNVHFIDMSDFFCKDGVCSMLDQKGNLLYRDREHLNVNGSLYVSPSIIELLRN